MRKSLSTIIRNSEVLVLLSAIAGVQIVFTSYLPFALYLDLPLIAVLYIGWYSSPFKSAFYGTLFGWLQDMISGNPLGFNGLSKTILGFSACYVSGWVILEAFWARLLLIGFLSLLDGAIIYAMSQVLQQPLMQEAWFDVAIRITSTAVVGALLFQVYDRIKFPPKDFRHIEDSS